MNAILDGNTAALNDYEIRQANAERVWQACVGEATQRVRENYLNRAQQNMESILDELVSMSAEQQAAFAAALNKPDFAEVGVQVHQAFERAADAYLESDAGQDAIATMVWIIHEEQRG
ncbi:MAG TPA: hypothetical protein VFW88_06980 [Burkholderiales bacterium]|nr:hypothetical protein [Burkholderiales bacterium]